jgi:amino-acid N-acetyltransferase
VFALQSSAIVLLSPLGFSPTGEAFNLTMEDVASSAAIALDADKLIFLSEFDGIQDNAGALLSEISESLAQSILSDDYLQADNAFYLQHALRACRGGVSRAHIIPFRTDGSLLLECFRHDGVGTMLVEENLDSLREASLDDVAGILSIIRPMEEDGTLVPRDHAIIERDIETFSVVEHDGVIFGCAALYTQPGHDIGEMACVAVNPNTQGQGDGERLLRRIEQRARATGLKRLFVQTTRTMHWFIKRGFRRADLSELPELRREEYNWDRRSQVLIKNL